MANQPGHGMMGGPAPDESASCLAPSIPPIPSQDPTRLYDTTRHGSPANSPGPPFPSGTAGATRFHVSARPIRPYRPASSRSDMRVGSEARSVNGSR